MVSQGPPTEPVPGRQRAWRAAFPHGQGGAVVLRHYIDDLAPNEDIQDYPPTEQLTWEQWTATHQTYGLTVEGARL